MDIEQKDITLEIDNLPNRLTLFRVFLVPIVVGLLSLHTLSNVDENTLFITDFLAMFFFIIASITDWLDGYIARKRNIVTVFGSFLDPIADKFLTVSGLIMLLGLGRIESVVVIVLVLREMYMTSLRLLAMNEGISVPVSNMAKWKTAMKMIGIPMLMAPEFLPFISIHFVGRLFLYLACLLSVWSATTYSLSLIVKIKLKRAEKKAKKIWHLQF